MQPSVLTPATTHEAQLLAAIQTRGLLARMISNLIADKVRRAVMALPDEPRVTVSLGVSAFPEDGDDIAALLRVADDALYRAKAEGRNRVCSVGDEPVSVAG